MASSAKSQDPASSRSTASESSSAKYSTVNATDSVLSTPYPLGSGPQGSLPHHQGTHDFTHNSCPSTSPTTFYSPTAVSQDHKQVADTPDPVPNTANTVSSPILIPKFDLPRRDPDRIPTPVSARGEKRGHLFPFSRTPSPHANPTAKSPSKSSQSSPESDVFPSGSARGRRRSSSSSSQSHRIFNMHSEQYSGRYMPTSPLSPRLPSSSRPLSPQQANSRQGHNRQTSRNLHMTLPRYHPANYQNHAPAATQSSTSQSPAITLHRVSQPTQLDSQRTMREKQRELLDSVRISSMIAASPAGQKPGSPRLDPLGSPKGPVTPLALEEPSDYFSVSGAGRRSPATSPGGRSHRSTRSDVSSGKEESKSKSQKKVDVYQ